MRLILALFGSGIWIGCSEFLRNEIVLKHYWLEHYAALGLLFPSSPVNGMVWVLWSFMLAGLVVVLLRRVRFVEALITAWCAGFVMMWLVIGNLAVLPLGILAVAVPWSMLEVAVAALIVRRIYPRQA